ncbi:hypothetical protein JJB27_09125 [Campylobacter fetus subsp. venerealis]|uniref:Lipoprotein n=1 Tax=Campylobacter hyointestinalis subsp. hyointestinalis TaxID=91352 RepID=A0A9W5AS50_CAMHY|nr:MULTISPECIES: hypothetical protein [Campylobacter]MBC3781446.1 hypothetical protein [Campylobacter fetus subsp. fetus]MBC3782906.1 hypothetical protein [Campylobacter fetus subsp. venerealis]MBK3499226.1 hypothetical protein [Campylobacter fetus subsp. venerealis]MBK3501169.1 hypothetical protein [Campylobacter fetus subsp. venerealis]MBK3503184.1 hypothetical protein [Campylobacter fetus subsp. venerealis]
MKYLILAFSLMIFGCQTTKSSPKNINFSNTSDWIPVNSNFDKKLINYGDKK